MSAPSHGSDPAPNEAPRAPSPSASRRAAGATHSAFVLHSHDWSESSLIVELFTRDGGRIVAMAKGAKRPTSHLRSVLMPFQPVQAQFVRSRGDDGEVRTLRNAEWGGGAVAALRGAEWFAAFYLNELLLRLLARDDPQARRPLHRPQLEAHLELLANLKRPARVEAHPEHGDVAEKPGGDGVLVELRPHDRLGDQRLPRRAPPLLRPRVDRVNLRLRQRRG